MTYPPTQPLKSADYSGKYPGSRINPNVGVIHTTEGTSLPTYEGGATAPNYTAVPDFRNRRLVWRQHFPDTMSSRALRNLSGGVETNTSNALQVELVGTCDRATANRWRAAGASFVFWPEAPEWALEDLAEFVAWAHRAHGIPLRAPEFLAYPASYGASPVRFSGTKWREFTGWVGHQHVPENSHGDPGNLAVARVLDMARDLVDGDEPDPMVIDVALVQEAFRDAIGEGTDPHPRRNASTHVRRLQRALNAVHGAGLRVDGIVGPATVAAWYDHESEAGGSGRKRAPDVRSIRALASPRFAIRIKEKKAA